MPQPDLADILAAVLIPPAHPAFMMLTFRRPPRKVPVWALFFGWGVQAGSVVLIAVSVGKPVPAVIAGVQVVLAVLGWWWWRRRRRRAGSLLGGKYAYIRDRMVRVMRDRARPRAVLHPRPAATWFDNLASWA